MDSDPLPAFLPESTAAPETSVWPPPPLRDESGPDFSTPFKVDLRAAGGTISDMRLGMLSVQPSGVSVVGKAVPRAEIQVPVLLVCLLLRLGVLLAYLILEYGCRRPSILSIPWPDVERVVLEPEKNRLCLVYRYPVKPDLSKIFSLTFRTDPPTLQSLEAAFRRYVPNQVFEGRTKRFLIPAERILGWWLVIVVVVVIVIAIASYFTGPHS